MIEIGSIQQETTSGLALLRTRGPYRAPLGYGVTESTSHGFDATVNTALFLCVIELERTQFPPGRRLSSPFQPQNHPSVPDSPSVSK